MNEAKDIVPSEGKCAQWWLERKERQIASQCQPLVLFSTALAFMFEMKSSVPLTAKGFDVRRMQMWHKDIFFYIGTLVQKKKSECKVSLATVEQIDQCADGNLQFVCFMQAICQFLADTTLSCFEICDIVC